MYHVSSCSLSRSEASAAQLPGRGVCFGGPFTRELCHFVDALAFCDLHANLLKKAVIQDYIGDH